MKNLEKLENFVLHTFVILLPLLVVPVFPNIYAAAKIVFLVITVLLLLVIKAIKINNVGELSYTSRKIDKAVVLFAISYLLSGIFTNTNKVEAFFIPGNATVIIFSTILYLLISQKGAKSLKSLSISLFASGVIVSLIVLFASAEILSQVPFIPEFAKNTNFSTLGSTLQTALFLSVLIPFGIHFFLKEKGVDKKILNTISLLILVFGLSVSVSKIIPTQSSGPERVRLNTLPASWEVMFGTLKQSPLFGAGPSNYLSAYTKFKPISINGTDLWNLRFANARNFVFTSITETGFLGLASLVLLTFFLIKIYKEKSRDTKQKKDIGWGFQADPWYLSFGVFIGISLLFPLGIVTTVLGFILLASLGGKAKKTVVPLSVSQKDSATSNLPSLIITIPLAIFIILVVSLGSGVVKAELTYKRALNAIEANKGDESYKLMQETITLSPYADRYRTSYSRINLVLVQNFLTNRQADENTPLDENEKNAISQLIQQAIREGKASVNLNPSRSVNWQNLAQIYLAFSPFTEKSIDFAIGTFIQAIRLDPTNPDLRITLGSIYYGLKDYESAKDVLKLAVAVKPDHANSHFNLALAYREDGQTERAQRELEAVLEILEPESASYTEVVELLNQLKTDAKSEIDIESQEESKLTVPEPIEEEPSIIELEEEDSPPATEEAGM